MEFHLPSPVSPNQDNSLQFQLSQKFNLKPVNQGSPDQHELNNLLDPCHLQEERDQPAFSPYNFLIPAPFYLQKRSILNNSSELLSAC